MLDKNRPLKILDYTPNLGMGGIATGMMRVLETIERKQYDIDFLLVDDPDKHYEAKAQQLGSQIYYIGNPKNPFLFARDFFRINKEHGPFDVIHSHAYTYSGYLMMLGKLAGIPIRITHAHNDHRHTARAKPWPKRLYTSLMRFFIQHFSTAGLTISPEAGEALFGNQWHADPRWVQIPVGTDFRPYEQKLDTAKLLQPLGMQETDKVIGIIGRFVAQKNHELVIDILAEFLKTKTDTAAYKFLFIGEGPLLDGIKEKARRKDILEHCVFAGVREDIPVLLTHLIDVVLFPSLHEGLGRVAVEGQAAGVPVVASEHIPSIADLYEGGVERLALDAPLSAWVEALDRGFSRGKRPLETCLHIAKKSPLSMDHHIKELEKFYHDQAIKVGLA